MKTQITAGDFLAGGGGVTEALSQIKDVKVQWVLNHDQMAIRTNMHNHKGIKHYWTDFTTQNEKEMEPVDFAWASIECTQHSRANGGREKKIGSYTLGWELERYMKHLMPMVLGIENVPEFKDWAPLDENGQPDKTKKGVEFERWKNSICKLGYDYSENINNAADYGIPTRRVRYFAFFTRKDMHMKINWPETTHNRDGSDGKQKWVACQSFIDIDKEGESIFGRQYNPNVPKGKRKPLVPNTLKRIAGGIKKYAPDLHFIFQYYSNGDNTQSIDKPLNSITTKDRHVMVSLEKVQFIADHCHQDNYVNINEPIQPILTRQEKRFVNLNYKFLSNYYGRNNGNPGSNNQNIDAPMKAIATQEKIQFISTYFSSSGNQGSQNQSIAKPLNAITTGTNKNALITALLNGSFDFDIKMRFLDPEELSRISTFPDKYFTDPLLKLTKKQSIKLIGNAVPPNWAKIIIEPVINQIKEIKKQKLEVTL